jgi:hypothetical protein
MTRLMLTRSVHVVRAITEQQLEQALAGLACGGVRGRTGRRMLAGRRRLAAHTDAREQLREQPALLGLGASRITSV